MIAVEFGSVLVEENVKILRKAALKGSNCCYSSVVANTMCDCKRCYEQNHLKYWWWYYMRAFLGTR